MNTALFYDQCKRVLPMRTEDERAVYVRALQRMGETGFLIDYRVALRKPGTNLVILSTTLPT